MYERIQAVNARFRSRRRRRINNFFLRPSVFADRFQTTELAVMCKWYEELTRERTARNRPSAERDGGAEGVRCV